jgi:hypothetical protein
MIQHTMSLHSFVLFALVGVDRRQDLPNAPPRVTVFFHLMGVTNVQSRGRWRYDARGVYYNLAGRPAPFWLLGCSTENQLLPWGDCKTCVCCLTLTAVPRLAVCCRKSSSLYGRLAKHVEVSAPRPRDNVTCESSEACDNNTVVGLECVLLCALPCVMFRVFVHTHTWIALCCKCVFAFSKFLRLRHVSPPTPPPSRKYQAFSYLHRDVANV